MAKKKNFIKLQIQDFPPVERTNTHTDAKLKIRHRNQDAEIKNLFVILLIEPKSIQRTNTYNAAL